MRLFVRILAGVAIAVVVLLGALAIVVATIDTRTLIAPLRTQLEAATGRAVTLGGKARIGVSLAPTLELDDVALANAPWGSAKDMLRAKRIEAQVALLPLLSRRVDVVRFTLVEPTILLETDARGRGNWTFGDAAAKPARSDPVGDAAGAFGLGEFGVENGELRWRDGRTGAVTTVRIERLYVRARDPAKPVVAEFRGTVADVPVALDGHFGPLEALRRQQWPWPVSVKGDVAGRKVEAQAKFRQDADGLEANELELASDATRLRGKLRYAARPSRAYVRFELAGDTVQVRDLALVGGAAASAAGAKPPPAAPPAREGRLFTATPLPLAGLRSLDAEGTLAVERLVLASGRTLGGVRVRMKLDDGRLDVPEWRAAALGGTAQGRLTLDARSDRAAALALRLDARGLDLAALLAAAGVARDVQGGETDLDIDVNARGASPRELAATLSGVATAQVGPARWTSSTAGLPAALEQLVVTLNPLAEKGAATDLRCAVVRLPLAGGVARIDRSIAFETDVVGATASGTIDLRSETLDLSLMPRVKTRGLADVGKLAGAVRVQGRLDAPKVVVDPVGSIAAVMDLAAIARGGRAALQGALTPAAPSGPGECAVALSGARAAAPAGAAPQAPSRQPPPQRPAPALDPAQELNRALDRLLKR